MDFSKADSNDGEQANDIVLGAYAAAAASCGAPPLAPFVRYNYGHLPSSFPREFLAVHAAFCIKDGEAPQIPDYLVTSSNETACTPSSITKELTSGQPSGAETTASEVTVVKSGSEAARGCGLGRKSFQLKAFRRAVEFQLPGGPDFKSIKSPLNDYVMRSASPDSISALAADASKAKGTQVTGTAVPYATAHTSARSSLNPLLSDSTDPKDVASAVEGKGSPHQCNQETGKGKGCDLVDNPLLQGSEESSTEHSGGSSKTTENDKSRDSEERLVKKRRGLNTAAMRRENAAQVMNESQGDNLCLTQAACGECHTPHCTKDHDVAAFMKTRPDDLAGDCVFVSRHGICPYGCCCRFSRSHVDASGSNRLSDGKPVTAADLEKYYELHRSEELNIIGDQWKTYFASRQRKRTKTSELQDVPVQTANQAGVRGDVGMTVKAEAKAAGERASEAHSWASDVKMCKRVGSVDTDKEDVGPEERRRRFATLVKGKTFLAPLTTLGNLPFRRLCTRLGADVTVGEMAVANSLVKGKVSELSLLRRHCTEKIFGVQVAAGFPDVARDCGQLLNDLNISCDFVDLNLACPLDQLHRKFKAGSCMLEKPALVESVVKSLMEACPSIPVTLKVRTAHYGKQHSLHMHLERLSRSGVFAITAHGRTAQQRYSKSADWAYLARCKELMPEDVMLIGCGDILSSAEFKFREESAGVDALMIGRGALIKPWIFTEIKEQRLWDISASERLSLVKEFVDNGLEHWGSDRRGVANTRRFLLELLSFMHRYIPPPFLELQPQLIHWRPSPFKGRSDLEVKLSSPKSSDWIEISSMFLGPPPKGFTFVPKHASNAYPVAST